MMYILKNVKISDNYLVLDNSKFFRLRRKNLVKIKSFLVSYEKTFVKQKVFCIEDSIEEAARNLKKLESIIDTTKMHSPSFKMILTGVGTYAYQRKDSVYIVPIGTLRD